MSAKIYKCPACQTPLTSGFALEDNITLAELFCHNKQCKSETCGLGGYGRTKDSAYRDLLKRYKQEQANDLKEMRRAGC